MKGTPSAGKHSKHKTHRVCRRCGKATYNIHSKKCSACGFGASPKLRSYSWAKRLD
ncbi:MAG: 50S ribosomal protein L37e [Conexivisphaerales archaeon]